MCNCTFCRSAVAACAMAARRKNGHCNRITAYINIYIYTSVVLCSIYMNESTRELNCKS